MFENSNTTCTYLEGLGKGRHSEVSELQKHELVDRKQPNTFNHMLGRWKTMTFDFSNAIEREGLWCFLECNLKQSEKYSVNTMGS